MMATKCGSGLMAALQSCLWHMIEEALPVIIHGKSHNEIKEHWASHITEEYCAVSLDGSSF